MTGAIWSRTYVVMLLVLSVAALIAGCATAPPGTAGPEMGPAEKAVWAAVEEYTAAGQAADVDRMLSHIAEGATIDSRVAGGKVTKAEFGAAMKKWLENPDNRAIEVGYRPVKIVLPDSTHAVVDAEQFVSRTGRFTAGGFDVQRRLEWKLEKRGEKWLIVEQTYK